MNDKREVLINQLRKRLEFVFVLVLFFPVLLASLFNISNAGSGDNHVLSWGAVISLLIIVFVTLEFSQKYNSIFALKAINILLISQIIAFIPHIYILAQYKVATLYFPTTLVIFISTLLVYLIPLVVIVVMVLDLIVLYYKGPVMGLWNLTKNYFKK